MPQTTYSTTMPVAYAGMKVDARDDFVATKAAEGAIPVGYGVVAGTDLKQVKVPTAGGGVFRGVALHPGTLIQDSSGVAAYADGDAVSLLRRGAAWVPCVEEVTEDDPVALIISGDDAGKFQTTDDGTSEIIADARFLGTTASGGLAPIEFYLPNS